MYKQAGTRAGNQQRHTHASVTQRKRQKERTESEMLHRRLGFSCMCTAWLPVVPVVGAAPLCLCLVPRWHRVRCESGVLVRCFYSGLVGGLPFVARVALLAYIGGLAFVVCAFGGFLLWLLPAYAFLTIASLCNTESEMFETRMKTQTCTSPLEQASLPAATRSLRPAYTWPGGGGGHW